MAAFIFGRALYINTLCFPPLLSVHIFSAKAHPKPEEGAVCHGAGQCRIGSHRSSAEKAGEKKEAGNTREGWPEDSGNA